MPPVSMETQNDGAAMSDEVLTIKEVAALLKLAEKTVYAMANAGELPDSATIDCAPTPWPRAGASRRRSRRPDPVARSDRCR